MDDRHRIENLHKQFVQLIKQILLREGYTSFSEEVAGPEGGKADFEVTNPEGVRMVGEIRLYQNSTVQPGLATFALKRLRKSLSGNGPKRGLLIVSGILPQAYLETVDFPNSMFKVWDYNRIANILKKHSDLDADFRQLINELRPFQTNRPRTVPAEPRREETQGQNPAQVSGSVNINEGNDTIVALGHAGGALSREEVVQKIIENLPETRGKELQAKLKATEAGNEKGVAAEFEKVCLEVLQYLFKGHLANWKPQEKTDKLHRYDTVARISSDHEFWEILQDHFKAKYVIFEFKNYTEKITQSEIYTTEKYLYLPAMRSLAIIISRLGANDNAVLAAKGALREHGKVILNLSIDDVCGLLQLVDEGKDASDGMTSILDNMLMHIER